MSTITRGYAFGATEQVNAQKLHDLVANADISGLSWSEFSGQTISISVGTPPTVAGVGWITARYEPPAASVSDFSATLSEFNYFINSPTGDVVLFGQTKMETRRIVSGFGGAQAAYGQGFGAHIATPNNSVTLTFSFEVGSAGYGNPHCIGVLQASASTSPTDGPGRPRLILRGYCHINSDGNGPTANSLNYVFANDNIGGGLGATSSTSMDKVLGLCLDNISVAGLRPAFLTGAPVWRG